jgi:4-hydroxy-3-methylbut-2-enyl diphosphate reductase
MIGHKGHPEVEGTMGQSAEGMHLVETAADVEALDIAAGTLLAYVTQTTLSVDDADKVVSALKQRFPGIVGPRRDDICYATQNRQDAVKQLAEQTQVVFVVGSRSSSNSNRLREVAQLRGARAYLIDDAGQIDASWLADAEHIGVTAGASAPEILVQNVVDALRAGGQQGVSQLEGAEENVTFALPKELK